MLVGSDDFYDLLINSDIFVDKSLMIKELLEDSGKVILITRPRRWGKSINMDMVRRFLEIELDNEGNPLLLENRVNYKLFAGGKVDSGFGETKKLKPLKIASITNAMKRQGQFPVIFITFKSVEGSSYHDIEQGVKSQLRKLFQSHRYLANSDKLASDERADFNHYLFEEVTLDNIKNSLAILSHLLYKHYNRKPWVLIDEYDTPINSAYRYFGKNEIEFQKVLELFRGIMKSTFKKETGESELPVERGLITGILRITKAELFSGLNNVREYTLLDKKFAKSYGFTQTEVDELLTKVPTKTDPEKIKDWYNGYRFGGEIIYNPWSIMQCLASEGELDYYWLDSGGTGLVDKVLLSDEMQEDLQSLAAGKIIISPITKQISFADINKPVGLLSLLLFSGYLNPTVQNSEENIYELSAPNWEVRHIYKARMLQWVTDQLKIDSSRYYSFISLLPAGKIEEFKERLQKLLLNSTSFHQTGEKKAELFYSGFMLGLINMLAPSYIIASEQESGSGRADVIMIPKAGKGDKAIIKENKEMTATEVQIRTEEQYRLMSPMVGRIESELLNPLIMAIYQTLIKYNRVPILEGANSPPEIEIEYVSPLSRVQKTSAIASVEQVLGFFQRSGISNFIPEIYDNINWDKCFKLFFELREAPSSILKNEQEVLQIRQQRKMMQMQQLQQQQQIQG